MQILKILEKFVIYRDIHIQYVELNGYNFSDKIQDWKEIWNLYTKCNTFKIFFKHWQWHVAGRWFSPGTPVSSTNKTDRHNITEILLKAP
jgi:hypothetical protein